MTPATVEALEKLTYALNTHDTLLEQERRRLRAFNKIIVRANEADTQQDLVNSILNSCLDILKFDMGGIYLIRKSNIELIASKFFPDSAKTNLICLKTTHSRLQPVFEMGKPVFFKNYDQVSPEISSLLGGIKTLIAVPIIYDNHTKGCITLASFTNRSINDEDCDILKTLGRHLGHILYRLETEINLNTSYLEVAAYNQELRATNEELQCSLENLESAQQELDIERQNLRHLLNKLPFMIFVISPANTILAINDAVRKHLKYPNGNLINQPISLVIPAGLPPNQAQKIPINLVSSDNDIISGCMEISDGLWDGNNAVFCAIYTEAVV